MRRLQHEPRHPQPSNTASSCLNSAAHPRPDMSRTVACSYQPRLATKLRQRVHRHATLTHPASHPPRPPPPPVSSRAPLLSTATSFRLLFYLIPFLVTGILHRRRQHQQPNRQLRPGTRFLLIADQHRLPLILLLLPSTLPLLLLLLLLDRRWRPGRARGCDGEGGRSDRRCGCVGRAARHRHSHRRASRTQEQAEAAGSVAAVGADAEPLGAVRLKGATTHRMESRRSVELHVHTAAAAAAAMGHVSLG